MIQPITFHPPLQNGSYFSVLKLIILQQNIVSVRIFGDQLARHEQGQEMDTILQHLVGPLPKVVYDLNITKTDCTYHDHINILNIWFMSQSFIISKNLNWICPSDFTMVLVSNASTETILPVIQSDYNMGRTVYGTINGSDIVEMNHHSSFFVINKTLQNLFVKRPLNSNNRSKVFRTFLQTRPLTSMLFFLDNKFGFYGPDAHLVQEISKMLNMSLILQTSAAKEFGPFESTLNCSNEECLKTQRSFRIHENIILPNVVSDFHQK